MKKRYLAILFLSLSMSVFSSETFNQIVKNEDALLVYKTPTCGCCKKWINILNKKGFKATSEDMYSSELVQFKIKNKIPVNMVSCHTARVHEYIIEGHVPPEDIISLIDKKINAVGLAVPEMPYGSPGMGPEEKREAYDVFLIKKDGTTKIFNSYDAKG